MASFWNERTEDQLRRWARERFSSGNISKMFTDEFGVRISRNSIIGKCARLGIHLNSTSSQNRHVVSRPKPTAPLAPRIYARRFKTTEERMHAADPPESIQSPESVLVAHTGAYAVLALNALTCRWPLGDPREEDFRFCCAPVSYEDRYCKHHWAVGFLPARTRTGKKEPA